ncbi:hypothetical protein ABL78_0597 [Leptomonas seymouri]|uniref:Uncharacterized protein n=1 Tax=Leptomonas seymouri TaxID=5684 RepID=A0A0N1I9Y1_LEPSE|nr:hypothetical protein ABL78_0597 [Leptomonas seymouri]|eukprot:KPI90215.1 hypothetical protein ABL78_0597 [Leptomonas seymouri]
MALPSPSELGSKALVKQQQQRRADGPTGPRISGSLCRRPGHCKMESHSSEASRFQVVFGRNSGSRKQRAKHAGSLSVGYDSSLLFDTDAKVRVMVWRGTGMTPNFVFSKMQAARRGAAWVAGTQLTLGGFDVVIEEVMALHLIPYDEEVLTEAATGREDGAAGPRHRDCSVYNNSSPASFNTTKREGEVADATGVALPEVGARTAAPSLDVCKALTGCILSSNTALPQSLRMRKTSPSATNDARRSTVAAGDQSPWPTPTAGAAALKSSAPIIEGGDAMAGMKRARLEMHLSTATRPTQRARRSAASLARELRSSYPQYF